MELWRRFLPARGGEVMVSRRAYATTIFGVRFFKSIEGFNGDDCRSGALVLRGTCTKTYRLSSTRLGRLRYESGDSYASAARSGGGNGRSVVHGSRCNFYYV